MRPVTAHPFVTVREHGQANRNVRVRILRCQRRGILPNERDGEIAARVGQRAVGRHVHQLVRA